MKKYTTIHAFRSQKSVALCVKHPYLKKCFAIRIEHFDKIVRRAVPNKLIQISGLYISGGKIT